MHSQAAARRPNVREATVLEMAIALLPVLTYLLLIAAGESRKCYNNENRSPQSIQQANRLTFVNQCSIFIHTGHAGWHRVVDHHRVGISHVVEHHRGLVVGHRLRQAEEHVVRKLTRVLVFAVVAVETLAHCIVRTHLVLRRDWMNPLARIAVIAAACK